MSLKFRSRTTANYFGYLLFCKSDFPGPPLLPNIKAAHCTPQQNCLYILNVFWSDFMQSTPYTLGKEWMCALWVSYHSNKPSKSEPFLNFAYFFMQLHWYYIARQKTRMNVKTSLKKKTNQQQDSHPRRKCWACGEKKKKAPILLNNSVHARMSEVLCKAN